MTAQTFNHFSLLPGEIRDQIWDMAVRPHGTRGVHYFSLFECHPHHPLPDRFNRIIKKTIYCQPNIIGAPLPQDDASPHSWTEGNRSTYAIDGGLWTACRESRAAMHRRYDIDRWTEFYDAQRKSWRDNSTSCRYIEPCEESKYGQMPATFGVDDRVDGRDDDRGDGDGKQYFTVLPLYDLIYLQPWACGLDFLQFIRTISFASPQYDFGGVRHIAFEYDPSWTAEEVWQMHKEWTDRYNKNAAEGQTKLSDNRWELYQGFIDFIRDNSLSYDSQIWLVDRRLCRKSTVLDERDMAMVFRGKWAGWKSQLLTFHGEDGSRYYTMPEDQERNFCCYDDGSDSIWEFIGALEDVAALWEAEEQEINVEIDDAPLVNRLGIMVCETDDDEGR